MMKFQVQGPAIEWSESSIVFGYRLVDSGAFDPCISSPESFGRLENSHGRIYCDAGSMKESPRHSGYSIEKWANTDCPNMAQMITTKFIILLRDFAVLLGKTLLGQTRHVPVQLKFEWG